MMYLFDALSVKIFPRQVYLGLWHLLRKVARTATNKISLIRFIDFFFMSDGT